MPGLLDKPEVGMGEPVAVMPGSSRLDGVHGRLAAIGGPKVALTIAATLVFVASALAVGPVGVVVLGLLLVLLAAPDGSASFASIALSARNVMLAGAEVLLLGYFAVEFGSLPDLGVVLLAGVLLVIPFALTQTVVRGDDAGASAVTITRRSLVMAVWGLVLLIALYRADGWLPLAFAAVAIVLPLVLAASRAWAARQGRVEYGLLRHPLRRDLRAHLVQGANVWLCCALLGAAITAGTAEPGRLYFSPAAFDVLHVALWAGLIVLAALALVPLRRVHVATNVLVLVLSGFLAVQLGRIAIAPSDPVALDSPLRGEWFVADGGRSALINHHYVAVPAESNAVDLVRLGANGQTHIGDSGSLVSYAGYGAAVHAPADGRVIELDDAFPDEAVDQTSADANDLVLDIGGGRYVVMAHLKQHSARVRVGDRVRRGQLLARVGNSGTQGTFPHLHMHVQNRPYDHTGGERHTYPMTFRRAKVTPSGTWPRADAGELRSGDRIRSEAPR